jgi:hypothetical protein
MYFMEMTAANWNRVDDAQVGVLQVCGAVICVVDVFATPGDAIWKCALEPERKHRYPTI